MIEATQPDRVRVTVRGEGEVELANPSVEGDQLVGADGVSLPLADVLMIEIRELSLGRTAGLGVLLMIPLGVLACAVDHSDCN